MLERAFQQSFKELELKDEAYFSDTTFVGNTVQKILVNFRNGENSLLDCFKNHPVLYNNYFEVWMILANAQKLLCIPGKKFMEEREKCAKACEEFTKIFLLGKCPYNLVCKNS